MFICSECRQQC